MYSQSDFQRYQALQSFPLLSDQHPSELMAKMLVLLPEDEKPGFFSEVCLWTASRLIFKHTCSLNLSVTHLEWLFELTNCGQSDNAASLSRLYLISLRMCMLWGMETCPWGLEAHSSAPRSSSVPQYQKMGVELFPPEFVGTTANGEMRRASVELPVPVRETN